MTVTITFTKIKRFYKAYLGMSAALSRLEVFSDQAGMIIYEY